MQKMRAAVFVEPGRIVLDDKPRPDVGSLDALVRITTTTICGTDVHILKGEYPVEKGLTIGHEPVGVIEKLGSAVRGFTEGERVIAGNIIVRQRGTVYRAGDNVGTGTDYTLFAKADGRVQFRKKGIAQHTFVSVVAE